MKIYLVKKIEVKTTKQGVTGIEYRSGIVDWLFSDQTKAVDFIYNCIEKDFTYSETYSKDIQTWINKKPSYEINGIKVYDGFELYKKEIQ